jgi:thiol-disulfide isomerase/thioredoxin
VILFTCNHCPTAQAYEDKFIKIVADYEHKSVGFVAISPNDPEAVSLSELGFSDMGDTMEEMKLRVAQKGYNFPYLYDGDSQKTALAYGPAATPHAFVFDQNRILVYNGRIDDTENPYIQPKTPDLKNVLDALIAGNTPPVARTKTFGCSIKWSWKGDWAKKQLAEWAEEPVTLKEIDLQGVESLFQNRTDKLRLVNLWATWCGPCIIEFPELVNINRMYRDRDFEFVAISTDKLSRQEQALSILVKKEAANTNYIYSGEDIYELIEVVDKDWQGALPYTALLAPGGKVLYKVQGTFDPPALKMAIVEHLGRYYVDND